MELLKFPWSLLGFEGDFREASGREVWGKLDGSLREAWGSQGGMPEGPLFVPFVVSRLLCLFMYLFLLLLSCFSWFILAFCRLLFIYLHFISDYFSLGGSCSQGLPGAPRAPKWP